MSLLKYEHVESRARLEYATLCRWLANRPTADVNCPICGPTSGNPGKRVLKLWGGQGRFGDMISYFCIRCGLKGWERPGRNDVPIAISIKKTEYDWAGQIHRITKIWNTVAGWGMDYGVQEYLSERCMLIWCADGQEPHDVNDFDLKCFEQWKHPVSGRMYGGMANAIRNPDGEITNIQFTLLTPSGKKAPEKPCRLFVSGAKICRGSAIRLGEAQEELAIAEGVETALAVRCMWGLTAWATAGVERLKEWVPPPVTKRVVICGDNDLNGIGQNATAKLADKLQRNGIDVEIRIPEQVGDWQDVYLGKIKDSKYCKWREDDESLPF